MKKLLLIRHAKASQTDHNDFERPLKPSGLEDAAVMAKRLHKQNIIPRLIISSPALRAKTTANIFAEHLLLPRIQTDKKIYDAAPDALFHIINDLPGQYDFIALVGHNPGISQVLYYLAGQTKDMPTSAVALIDFEAEEWKLISENTGSLVYYDTPGK